MPLLFNRCFSVNKFSAHSKSRLILFSEWAVSKMNLWQYPSPETGKPDKLAFCIFADGQQILVEESGKNWSGGGKKLELDYDI